MRRLTYYFIFVLLTGNISWVDAQDFRQELQVLHDKYQGADKVRIQLTVSVFDSPATSQPFYQEKMMIEKEGDMYRHKLKSMDVLMNQHYMIMIDHSSKQIVMNRRDAKGEEFFHKQIQFNLDSILQYYEDVQYATTEQGFKKFTVKQKTGQIEKIELYIDQSKKEIRQINYLYKAGQWVTIFFDQFDLSPVFATTEFDDKQFVRQEGKDWLPVPSLSKYEVIQASDHLSIEEVSN